MQMSFECQKFSFLIHLCLSFHNSGRSMIQSLVNCIDNIFLECKSNEQADRIRTNYMANKVGPVKKLFFSTWRFIYNFLSRTSTGRGRYLLGVFGKIHWQFWEFRMQKMHASDASKTYNNNFSFIVTFITEKGNIVMQFCFDKPKASIIFYILFSRLPIYNIFCSYRIGRCQRRLLILPHMYIKVNDF